MGKARDACRLVFEALRARIVAGEYPLGGAISILDVAQAHETSATPVREALARLLGAGLVRDARARGYAYLDFDRGGLSDTYRLQSVLLQAAARPWGPDAPPHVTVPKRAPSMRQLLREVMDASQRPALIVAHARVEAILGSALRAEARALADCPGLATRLSSALSAGDQGSVAEILADYETVRQAQLPNILLLMHAEETVSTY